MWKNPRPDEATWEVTENVGTTTKNAAWPRSRITVGRLLALGLFLLMGGMGVYLSLPTLPSVDPALYYPQEEIARRISVRAVAFRPDGALVAAGREDGTVTLWRLPDEGPPTQLGGPQKNVRDLAFGPDGDVLVVAGGDAAKRTGELYVWSVAERTLRAMPGPLPGPVACIAFHPKEKLLAVGNSDGTLQLYETVSWSLAFQVQAHQDEILSLAFSTDGRFLATGGNDQVLKVWEVPGLQQRGSLMPRLGAVRSAAFSPNGEWIAAVGGESKEAALRQVGTGHVRRAAVGAEGLRMVAFDPQGEWLAVASGTWPRKGSTQVLDVRSLRQRPGWTAPDTVAYCLDFAPNGMIVATGEADGGVYLRDATTGTVLTALH